MASYSEQPFPLDGRSFGSADGKAAGPAADKTTAIVYYCFDKGIILLSCGTYGNVIRTLMPLVIMDEQLDRGFQS